MLIIEILILPKQNSLNEYGKWSDFIVLQLLQFPGRSEGKESACNAGYLDSIPVSGRYPGEGNGTYSSIFAWRIPWREEPGGL